MVMTPRSDSRTKLLQATLDVVRERGYAASRVEDVCAAASLTKGSFFHHFKSKEDLTLAAAELWRTQVHEAFAAAPYRKLDDPLARLLGYVAFRKALLVGKIPAYACFAGTMIQEVHETHPELRDACALAIDDHVADLAAMVDEVLRDRGLQAAWTAESLALYMQAVLQGALILAKARQSAAPALASLDHLSRHLEGIFADSGEARSRGRPRGAKQRSSAGKANPSKANPSKANPSKENP
jgi:TetR/AcrR family transcriptional repressor of nem operon